MMMTKMKIENNMGNIKEVWIEAERTRRRCGDLLPMFCPLLFTDKQTKFQTQKVAQS